MGNRDDDFGPVLRGGPKGARTRGGTSTPVKPLSGEPARARTAVDDDGYGPPQSGRGSRRPTPAPAPPKRPRRRRGPIRILLTILIVGVLLLVGSGLALAAYASSKVDRVPVEGLSSAAGMRMNILIVGSDSREGLTDEEVLELGTGRVEGKRTDTIMVLAVRGTQAAMLSFPRDLYVTRCDGSQGRINAAFNIGNGPSCLTQTVQQLSGIPITHYVELSFLSFVQIVEAVGGVEVCLEAPLQDVSAAIDLPAGCSELSGPQALGFVRARKVDSDFGRIERQQYFLGQLAGEIASPSTVANVPRLVRTAGAGGEALLADEGFGALDLMRLAVGARGLAGGGMGTHIVPATPASIGGAAVLMPDQTAAAQLFADFREGRLFGRPAPELGEQPAG